MVRRDGPLGHQAERARPEQGDDSFCQVSEDKRIRTAAAPAEGTAAISFTHHTRKIRRKGIQAKGLHYGLVELNVLA